MLALFNLFWLIAAGALILAHVSGWPTEICVVLVCITGALFFALLGPKK